jgi:organic radical activating enzyme
VRACVRRIGDALAHFVESRIHIGSLEFFLADTCNLRCTNCVSSSPFLHDANEPNLQAFRESLLFLAAVLRSDQIKFLGGEPLLNPDICSFMQAARESRIFRMIRVTTNGLLLGEMSPRFWALADVVELSIYPATSHFFSIAKLESLKSTAAAHDTTLEVRRHTHFMQAIRETRATDASATKQVFSACGEAHQWPCHTLYNNRFYICSRVHTLDKVLYERGVGHESFVDSDGVSIDGRPTLRRELLRYLASVEPLNACSFCLGTSGPFANHTQLPTQRRATVPLKAAHVQSSL